MKSDHIITLRIYNIIGDLILIKNLYLNKSILNIESLTSGIYFIEVELNNGSVLNKKDRSKIITLYIL